MPIGFQVFMFLNSKLNKYTVANNFSHVLATEPLNKVLCKIFPRTGKVRAV